MDDKVRKVYEAGLFAANCWNKKVLCNETHFAKEMKIDGKELNSLNEISTAINVIKIETIDGENYLIPKSVYDELGKEGVRFELRRRINSEKEKETQESNKLKLQEIEDTIKNLNIHVVDTFIKCPECGKENVRGINFFWAQSSLRFNNGAPTSTVGSTTCSQCSALLFFAGFEQYAGTNLITDPTIKKLLAMGVSKDRILPHKKINAFLTKKYNELGKNGAYIFQKMDYQPTEGKAYNPPKVRF